MSEPPKGFVSAPTRKQLELTPEEKEKLEQLLEWQRQSEKSNYILGGSINCVHCAAQNNPNNSHCYGCGKPTRHNEQKDEQ